MSRLTAVETARICDGSVIGAATQPAASFVADSRRVTPGAAFVAVRGGHDHVAEALAAGASFALVERPDAVPEGGAAVVVADIQRALHALAAEVRGRLDVGVVGITGSTGKTLTKDLLAAALRPRFRVHASEASYNNEIGVPLTVLTCPDEAEVLVCELGARAPGQIADLCEAVRPDVGIVTGVGWTHLEVFGTRDAIASTKSELPASLSAGGLAVVPSTDDYLHVLASSTSARVRTVGPGGHARVTGPVVLDPEGRASAELTLPGGGTVPLRLPLPGRHLVSNAALALVAATEMGVDAEVAAEAISHAPTSGWRMQVLHVGTRTVVNDAYNANPTSTAAALRTVREMAGSRPAWAVLGEMAELGPAADAEHFRIGRLAAGLGYERVVAVGRGATVVSDAAGPAAMWVETADEASRAVADAPQDAVVLVKGSRVAGLERLVELVTEGG